ncbi:MAG: hypothetical protein R2826_05755 [Thermoleophilia bacterium]
MNLKIVTPANGDEVVLKSEKFTTSGVPLMVHLTITRRYQNDITGGVEAGWHGIFGAYLQTPGSYWDRETAPFVGFGDWGGSDLNDGDDKLATQFLMTDGQLVPAGTYILRVEAANYNGTVALVELPAYQQPLD